MLCPSSSLHFFKCWAQNLHHFLPFILISSSLPSPNMSSFLHAYIHSGLMSTSRCHNLSIYDNNFLLKVSFVRQDSSIFLTNSSVASIYGQSFSNLSPLSTWSSWLCWFFPLVTVGFGVPFWRWSWTLCSHMRFIVPLIICFITEISLFFVFPVFTCYFVVVIQILIMFIRCCREAVHHNLQLAQLRRGGTCSNKKEIKINYGVLQVYKQDSIHKMNTQNQVLGMKLPAKTVFMFVAGRSTEGKQNYFETRISQINNSSLLVLFGSCSTLFANITYL